MTHLKPRLLLLVLSLSAAQLCVQPLAGAPTSIVPEQKITVRVQSEGEMLAKGFAEGFKALPGGAKYVSIEREGKVTVLGTVREVQAVESAIVLKLDSGLVYVVPANDILFFTNEKPQ